jgi:hypothetical protein
MDDLFPDEESVDAVRSRAQPPRYPQPLATITMCNLLPFIGQTSLRAALARQNGDLVAAYDDIIAHIEPADRTHATTADGPGLAGLKRGSDRPRMRANPLPRGATTSDGAGGRGLMFMVNPRSVQFLPAPPPPALVLDAAFILREQEIRTRFEQIEAELGAWRLPFLFVCLFCLFFNFCSSKVAHCDYNNFFNPPPPEAAAEAGLALTCGCCFSPIMPHPVSTTCTNEHPFCKRCVVHTMRARLGVGSASTKCFDTSECQGTIPERELQRLMPAGLVMQNEGAYPLCIFNIYIYIYIYKLTT